MNAGNTEGTLSIDGKPLPVKHGTIQWDVPVVGSMVTTATDLTVTFTLDAATVAWFKGRVYEVGHPGCRN